MNLTINVYADWRDSMKKLVVLFLICCLFTACGTHVEPAPSEAENVIEENQDENEDSAVVMPLPVTVDMENLDNCIVAVSVGKGEAYVDDAGEIQMDVTVHTYDLYDMVDISMLEEGDTIRLRKEDVLIETLERNDLGAVIINGGLDVGGYELITDDSGVFFEIGYSDVKSYYEVGKITLTVSPDFQFIDKSDLDKGEQIYHIEDFIVDQEGVLIFFELNPTTPHNTKVVIEDGVIVSMERVYTP